MIAALSKSLVSSFLFRKMINQDRSWRFTPAMVIVQNGSNLYSAIILIHFIRTQRALTLLTGRNAMFSLILRRPRVRCLTWTVV